MLSGTPGKHATRERIMEAVMDAATRHAVPGLVAGVSTPDGEWVVAHGVADTDTARPVLPDTPFRTASITKLITAAAAVRLARRGEVDLDVPISQVLPDLPLEPVARERLTLTHCLSHRTGFESDRLARPEHDDGEDVGALGRMVNRFGALRQWVPPGTTYAYCNHGFDFAGRVLEVVAGRPYAEVVRREVLAPLGMVGSGFLVRGTMGGPHATGHRVDPATGSATPVAPYGTPRRTDPSGGLVAPAADLLRFGRAFLPGEPVPGWLDDDDVARMLTPVTGGDTVTGRHGLAWQIDGDGPARRVGHTGTHPGFKSSLVAVPSTGVIVVLLANGDSAVRALPALQHHLLTDVLGQPPVPTPAAVSLDDATLARLVGRYGEPEPRLTVTRDDVGLLLHRVPAGNPATFLGDATVIGRLEPLSPWRFRLVGGDDRMADRAISFTRVDEAPYEGTWLYLGQTLHRRQGS